MTFTIAALVLTNLLYVVVPVVVATLVSGVYVLRHRKPKSVEWGIESFSRELRALAPDPRGAAQVASAGLRRRPIPTAPPSTDPDDGDGSPLGSPSG